MLVIEKKKSLRQYELLEKLYLCKSSDVTRDHMNGVFYDREKQCFVATDGRRMLIVWEKGLPGLIQEETTFFSINKQGSTFILNNKQGAFFNYQRVIPDKSFLTEYPIELEIPKPKKDIYNEVSHISEVFFHIFTAIGQPFNYQWIIDLWGFNFTLSAHQEEGKMFILENSTMKFLGMPLIKPATTKD